MPYRRFAAVDALAASPGPRLWEPPLAAGLVTIAVAAGTEAVRRLKLG